MTSTPFILYAISMLVVGWLVYIVDDPYHHESAWSRWSFVVLVAPLWPLWLIWVFCVVIWYEHIQPFIERWTARPTKHPGESGPAGEMPTGPVEEITVAELMELASENFEAVNAVWREMNSHNGERTTLGQATIEWARRKGRNIRLKVLGGGAK